MTNNYEFIAEEIKSEYEFLMKNYMMLAHQIFDDSQANLQRQYKLNEGYTRICDLVDSLYHKDMLPLKKQLDDIYIDVHEPAGTYVYFKIYEDDNELYWVEISDKDKKWVITIDYDAAKEYLDV